MRKALTGTALLISILGSTAAAQSNGVPREFPPADYTGNQYVDSEGCAFIRAGISGNTTWVPRVDPSRRQLCNFQPTFAQAEPEVAAPAEPAVDVAAAAEPEEQPAPIETVEAAPAPTQPLVILPSAEERAASNRPVTVPVPRANTAPPPSPRVIAAAPTATAPAPDADAAPRPMLTSEQVCYGKSGLQPGFISARTGETVDCGPGSDAVAAAIPRAVSAAPVPAMPEHPRMTMAEICAAAAADNSKKFVNAMTGEPIICDAPVAVARATQPAPAPQAAAEMPVTASACPQIPHAAGQSVRCGPQTKRPWTVAGSDGQSTRARAQVAGLGQRAVPASNPVGAVAEPQVPAGYQQVWTDGRLNAQRGLPQRQGTVQVSTRQAPQIVAPAYRYVQVGSFGVHSNADNLLARLQGMGLPTGTGRSGALKIVAVGPLNSAAEVQRALGIVRGMGFTDAFPRN